MKIDGKNYRTIWEKDGYSGIIQIIDQRYIPYKLIIKDLIIPYDYISAIKDMLVRGAPLIGVTACYGMHAACVEAAKNANFDKYVDDFANKLIEARPTAINLKWAVNNQLNVIGNTNGIKEKIKAALEYARLLVENDVDVCKKIGEFGSTLIEEIRNRKNDNNVNILTHCNAGWLATVDNGTATAPIYEAFSKGVKIHVWVDETRPRNQGARLTSWELNQQGIPNTVIVDNAGGHLMQNGLVDLVIVGSDRTTYTGDVANKIGTYLKALAAKANDIPFYVALPSSTIDWEIEYGLKDIHIEERDADEVRYVEGFADNEIKSVLITPEASKAANFAFDVTPRELITGLITERGICYANKESIYQLFPEKKK